MNDEKMALMVAVYCAIFWLWGFICGRMSYREKMQKEGKL